jgi:hypothetical protein
MRAGCRGFRFILHGQSPLVQLSRENHPTVECRCPPAATGTRADPYRVGRSLDRIAEPELLVADEARETNAIRLTLFLLPGFAR